MSNNTPAASAATPTLDKTVSSDLGFAASLQTAVGFCSPFLTGARNSHLHLSNGGFFYAPFSPVGEVGVRGESLPFLPVKSVCKLAPTSPFSFCSETCGELTGAFQ